MSEPATTEPACSMGHIALHYGAAEDGPVAAKLMRLLGFRETQVIPLANGNFYRFVVDERHDARGDGIVYLSALPAPQAALVAAIHDALKVGTPDEHDAVKAMRAMMTNDFEASFHVGFLLSSLEELEAMMLGLRDAVADDPELAGRVTIGMNRARPGDPGIDARLDASPLFADVTRHAYGSAGVQVFVETDLLRAGQLGDSMVLEFDYVFAGHDSHILSVVEM